MRNAKEVGEFFFFFTGIYMTSEEQAQSYWEIRKTAKEILDRDLTEEKKERLAEIKRRR